MTDLPRLFARIARLDIHHRCALALAAAEKTAQLLDEPNGTRRMAKTAVCLCWPWVDGKDIQIDEVVVFIHGPDGDDLLVRRAELPEGRASNAIAAVEGAIEYCLRCAMDAKGVRERPASVVEVNEETLYEVVELALGCAEFSAGELEKVSAFLEEWERGESKVSEAVPLSDRIAHLMGQTK